LLCSLHHEDCLALLYAYVGDTTPVTFTTQCCITSLTWQ